MTSTSKPRLTGLTSAIAISNLKQRLMGLATAIAYALPDDSARRSWR
jgi:hypothetical protein